MLSRTLNLDFGLRRGLYKKIHERVRRVSRPRSDSAKPQLLLIAPHVMKVKVPWLDHAVAPPEALAELELQVHVTAVDCIDDKRYELLDKVRVELEPDVFINHITVEPTFGELEGEFERQDLLMRRYQQEAAKRKVQALVDIPPIGITARIETPDAARITKLRFDSAHRSASVGRSEVNELQINDPTVDLMHAVLTMKGAGNLFISDANSSGGTNVNGYRIFYGDEVKLKPNDVVTFGMVKVRFREI